MAPSDGGTIISSSNCPTVIYLRLTDFWSWNSCIHPWQNHIQIKSFSTNVSLCTCSKWSRLVQTCLKLLKLVQTSSNWFRLVQVGLNMLLNLSKLFQTCPNLSKLVYSWNNSWTTPFLFAFLNCVSTILRGDLGGAHVRLLTPYVDAFLFVTILDH